MVSLCRNDSINLTTGVVTRAPVVTQADAREWRRTFKANAASWRLERELKRNDLDAFLRAIRSQKG